MRELFSLSLVNCIRDLTPPANHELALESDKIWSEGVRHLRSGRREIADVFAKGAYLGSSAMQREAPSE